jgi:hypothetical protein
LIARAERLTGLEDHQGLEADLNLGNESLDLDNQVEDDLEIGGNEDIGIEDKTLESGHAVEEHLEVGLERNDDLEQSLSIDLGGGNDLG